MNQSIAAPCVAVTGASGLIGRHLCRSLTASGWRVRALVRDPRRRPEPAERIERYQCDLPDTIDAAGLRGADVLVHSAFATRPRSTAEAQRVNEEGSLRLFDLARRQGVGKIVFLSSFSARPDAQSYYGRSKYRVEQQLDPQSDLVVRAGLVLASDGGLFQRIVGMLQHARVLPLIGGGRIVQTLHIDDLCQACRRAIELGVGGLLHVAERDGLPFYQLLRLVLEALRRRCLLVPVPVTPVLATLLTAERLGLKLAVSSENLLGIQALRPASVDDDLSRLGLAIRPAAESIAALLPRWKTTQD